MKVLAIETSCDETAAAVLDNGILRSSIVASQQVHLPYGGVVPELASRAHIAKIVPVVERALQEAALSLDELDSVAATYGPGLIGSLLVGLTFAKGLALSRNIPFIGIDHIEGHIFSGLLEQPDLRPPFLSLVVSGGHTLLVEVRDVGVYKLLGQTRDDAAGEAFDKVAKILGLPYPGGPAIDNLAKEGNPHAIDFPVSRLKGNSLDFSFSGLKTAVLYYYEALPEEERRRQKADIAASFQAAAVRALVGNVKKALRRTSLRTLVAAGGVARNSALAAALHDLAQREKIRLVIPAGRFCTDNAAMIGVVASLRLARGERSPLSLPAVPNLTLPMME